MSSEERVKAELSAGTFSGCLVEGDAEENARERTSKRRAIIISIVLQSVALAMFVMAPLFAKPAELTRRVVMPIPPYRNSPAPRQPAQPSTARNQIVRCVYCPPTRIPPTVPTPDVQGALEIPGSITDSTGSGSPYGIGIVDARAQPPRVEDAPHEKKRVHESHIDPALLTRRIDPVFPSLARQTRRSGKVELHALIGADRNAPHIHSVTGAPLF